LTRDWRLRTVAILLAIGMWLFVNGGQRSQQNTMQVPVRYRGLPQSMIILGPRPEFVDVQLSGPGTLLSLLDPGRLALRLDLAGVSPGQIDFKIDPTMFAVPRQVAVDRISPATITLDVDRMLQRELPVRVDVRGPVTSGYAIPSVEVTPPTVAVFGPGQILSKLENIQTDPVDVRDATEDFSRTLGLVSAGQMVTMPMTEVQAKFKIQEVMTDRLYDSVDLAVRDADYKTRIIAPRQVSVTVRGPSRKLSNLSLDGSVYVDAHGAEPGTHELPIEVDLPAGVNLVRAYPEKAKLRVLMEKLAPAG
jgi:YbbR domain-containing protein